MKNFLLFLFIGVTHMSNSQEWVSMDGPNGRPEAKIVQGVSGEVILQTSCAIFSSENNGQNYHPILHGNSNAIYAMFLNKLFFLSPSSISSLQNLGSGWVEQSSSVYGTTDLFADNISLYRACDQGVERANNGFTWLNISNGLPQHYVYIPTGPTTADSFLVYEAFSVCSNDNYLFAATDSAIYRTDKTNILWAPMYTGLPIERFELVRCQGDTVFAINDEDVYFSYDAGASWSLSISLPNGNDVRRIRFIQDTVFLATSLNGLQWSSDFGLSWFDGNSGLTSLDVWDINRIDNEYYMAGAHGSSKGFPNWVSSDYGAVCAYSSDLAQSQNGIVASNNPDLYYLGDDSTQWANTTKDIPHWTSRTVEYANNKVIICLDPDTNYDSLIRIMESSDNGLNWTTISTLGTEWLRYRI